MSPVRSRAVRWRAALVGLISAEITLSAHAAGGGGIPGGPALVLVLLVCATAGAVVACARPRGRLLRPLVTITALLAAQGVGHTALATTAHHHGAGAADGRMPMLAAHVLAALVLGSAISAVEYLYVVAVSVLSWLRLFTVGSLRPASRIVWFRPDDPVLSCVALRSGLGMRAPPAGVLAA